MTGLITDSILLMDGASGIEEIRHDGGESSL